MSILIGICVAVAVAWFGFKIIGKSETPATLKWPWSSCAYWIVFGGAVAIIAVVNALPPTPKELAAQAKAEPPRKMTEKEQNEALNRMFPEMQGNIDRAWHEIELQKKLGVEGYERHQDDALRDDAYDRMMRNR
jgi:hypothetical protein